MNTKGIIEVLKVDDPVVHTAKATGKEFKSARFSIKLKNGDWHNGSVFEKNGEFWPRDVNGEKFQVGQEIVLSLEKNEKYVNVIDKKSVIVNGGGAGVSRNEPTSDTPTQKSAEKPTIWVMCLDAAVDAVPVLDIDKVNSQEVISVADDFFATAVVKMNQSSEFHAHLWVNLLVSAIKTSKAVGASKLKAQQLMRVADEFYNEALKK